MTDIEKFIQQRKEQSPKAWANFEAKYEAYTIGALLAEFRERSGLSLTRLAQISKMQKTALSRLENHGEDVRLSTIFRYVEATGKPLTLTIAPSGTPSAKSPGRAPKAPKRGTRIALQTA